MASVRLRPFIEYLQSIGNVQFAGAMNEQAGTLNVALSNMGDAFSKLVKAIGDAGLTDILIFIADKVKWLAQVITDSIEPFKLGFFEATRTPLERYNKEMAQLNALLEKGYINQDTFGRAVEQANEKLGKATKQTSETIEGEFSRIGETMEGTIADSLDAIGGRFDGFGDFFKGFLSDLNRTLLQYALKDLGVTGKGGILDGLFGSIGGLFGGGGSGGGSGFGGFLSGIGDFFGGFFADGGRLSPGKFGIVGERGPELAYAGNAPMHIMPDMGMSAAPITINMNVQTPDVRSFKQSQSQIAADMARSIERARRNL